MSDTATDSSPSSSWMSNFDGYVLIFCALIISALKVIELILKKKQNTNFIHLNNFEDDLKKLKNDFVELSRIQSGILSNDHSPNIKDPSSTQSEMKRYSKSMTLMKEVPQSVNKHDIK